MAVVKETAKAKARAIRSLVDAILGMSKMSKMSEMPKMSRMLATDSRLVWV